MKRLVVSTLVLCVAAPANAEEPRLPIGVVPLETLDGLAHADAEQLLLIGASARKLAAELEQRAPLFERQSIASLRADERAEALDLFARVIATEAALDRISQFHFDFHKIDVLAHPVRHARSFLLGFASYVTQIWIGMKFIERTLAKPQFEKLLDEGSLERGIPPGAYARLKWNVVHVQDVGRIFAAHQYHKLLALTTYKKLENPPLLKDLRAATDEKYEDVKTRLKTAGVKLFAQNGLDILKDGGHQAWMPVQTGVAEWMGDTRVHRVHDDLIKLPQITAAVAISRPGDIVVERRNWYLSNVGLPGFWPHAALYLGTPEDLAEHFDADQEVTKTFGAPFSQALAKKYPRAWAEYKKGDHGQNYRFIEAMSEGVVFTTAEHSLSCDYAASLRPKLSKVEVAKAIDRAFSYQGRPYDFDFDFETDSSLVCSELIYKAYEPRAGAKGLKLDSIRMMGRPTLPPNTMIAQFDRELGGSDEQLSFVFFLDGSEAKREAVFRDAGALRTSHRRAKWDVAQK